MNALIYGDGLASARAACLIGERLGLVDVYQETPSPPPSSLRRAIAYYGETDISCHTLLRTPFSSHPYERMPLMDRYGLVEPGDTVRESKAVEMFRSFSLHGTSATLFKPDRKRRRRSITVILNQYKRNTTEAQIRSIMRQSAYAQGLVDAIVIYQNQDYVDLSFLRSVDWSDEQQTVQKPKRRYGDSRGSVSAPPIQIVHSMDRNFKYHGRFTLPLLLDTEFVALFDDDTLPQSEWLLYAMSHCEEHNAIVGAVGVVVGSDRQFYFNAPVDGIIEVRNASAIPCERV